MELHQLRYVLAVARAGSFSRAAEDLYLAQPSLSVQIRKLEKELGIALFDRLGRRVVLTAAGEEFVAHVQQALAHLDRARAGAAAVRSLQGGRVSIGVLPSVGAGLMRCDCVWRLLPRRDGSASCSWGTGRRSR
ncbi:LysR family transcriptional regulator [Saccharopolyspora sp. TS4A08]|uniref:LysR family transcriptional regulator n=1 Tax=Saccharopolyspora ipomoeae TaxID=3042027 RepID=A0ABT6PRA1_9PSEU|nr:LysR family transcriptional regulator [Saccharopolyspora sp. TS4A08]MDI2030543.1 LysR family transcriptional regulator [Saccharopolyspora sp. TS4A08]